MDYTTHFGRNSNPPSTSSVRDPSLHNLHPPSPFLSLRTHHSHSRCCPGCNEVKKGSIIPSGGSYKSGGVNGNGSTKPVRTQYCSKITMIPAVSAYTNVRKAFTPRAAGDKVHLFISTLSCTI